MSNKPAFSGTRKAKRANVVLRKDWTFELLSLICRFVPIWSLGPPWELDERMEGLEKPI